MHYNWAVFLLLLGCVCSEDTSKIGHSAYSLCDGLVNGEVKPSPLDCFSYIECTLDGALLRYCADGLEYDATLKICNWPEYANCKIDKVQQDVVEHLLPLLPLPGNIVDTDASTTTSASSSSPIVNDIGMTTTQSFEKNPWSQSPVNPVFIAIDVNNGQITDPMAKYNPHHIECRHFGAYFLPHPSSCRQYFVCAYGHLHQHHCGSGTLWNYLAEECELSDRAICYSMAVGEETDDVVRENENNDHDADTTSSVRPHTVTEVSDSTSYLPHTSPVYPPTVCYTIPTAGTTSSSVPSTQSTWTGYSPTSTLASEYTTPSTTETTTAPITTTTDTSTTTTEAPNNSSATTRTTTTITDKIGSSTPRADTAIPACPSNSQAYLPHPKDCSKYYICIMGMPVLTSCPQGLRWDQNAEFCDLANNVECKLNIHY